MSVAMDHENTPIDLRAIGARIWQKRFRIVIVTALLCGLTFLFVSTIPKTYESSASILVESRDNTFTRATNDSGGGNSGLSGEVIMSSQIELIQSSETLLRVVRTLNLTEVAEFNGTSTSPLASILALIGAAPAPTKGTEQKALAFLDKAVTVIQERDSRVISILTRAQDRDLAATISNAIAEAHVNRRTQLSIDDTADAGRWLESEIEKMRISVVEAESAVAAFRVENDLFVGTNNTSLLDQQLTNISSQISTAQERKITARSRATLIRNLLSAGQPIDGVAEVQNSVIIQRLSQDKARLQGEKAQLTATLLPNHPQVRSITAQVNEINQQILREGRRVADAIMAAANIEDTLVASLQNDMARLKISASTAATSTVELQELEREAAAQSDLLQTYLSRFREASARVNAGASLPDVRVVTVAMPALRAAAPKATMILIAVAIVSIAVQIGGILFAELTVIAPAVATNRNTNFVDEPQLHPAEPHEEFVPPNAEELSSQPPVAPPAGPVPATALDQDVVPEQVQPATPTARPVRPRVRAPQNTAPQESRAPQPTAFVAEPPMSQSDQDFYELSQSLVTGQENLVFLTTYDRMGDSTGVGEMLISEILAAGRSVAIVDAGSNVVSVRPGISDLAANGAEFGDVVFPNEAGGLTEVYWGTRSNIYGRSEKPAILVEALCDICDVVLVFAGSVGVASNLPLFAGLQGTLALVAGQEPNYDAAQNALDDAASLGFDQARVLIFADQQSYAA